jgi:hypothetical protein
MTNEDLEKINLEFRITNQRLTRELQTLKLQCLGLAVQIDSLNKRCLMPEVGFKEEHSDQLERISRELKNFMNG